MKTQASVQYVSQKLVFCNSGQHLRKINVKIFWSWPILLDSLTFWKLHNVKSVRIGSYSGPHFSAFGLNMDRYSVSLRIQSEFGKCGPE